MTGLGGLPLPKRPDQQRDYPPAGVQPGSNAGIFRGRLVVVSGSGPPGSGVYVYNLAGQLIASMAAANGTGPNGGTVRAGVASYNPVLSQISVRLFSGEVIFFPNNPSTLITSQAQIIGNDTTVASTSPNLQILGPGTGNGEPTLALFGESQDTTAPSSVLITTGAATRDTSALLEVQGEISTTSGVEKIVGGVAETVHQFTSGFPAGFTGTVSYWLLPDGVSSRVSMDFHITIANGTVVTNNEDLLVAVGGSYHFSDNKFVFGQINGGGLAGNQFAPMRISSTGELFYGGPAFTAAGNAFFYGGSTYSVAV